MGDELTPPNSSNMIVARTEGYTYTSKVWAVCIIQAPFSAAPCQTLSSDSQQAARGSFGCSSAQLAR